MTPAEWVTPAALAAYQRSASDDTAHDALSIKRLNREARAAAAAAGGGGARFVPTFCASAGRLGEPHATLDGVHADDRINWAKAQLVLGELCEA